jgi:hypothetical protein
MSKPTEWRASHQGVNYSARIEIDGIKLELTRDAGTRESYGGKQLLARHFLNKAKWQALVKEQFGEVVFNEIFSQLQKALSEFESAQ